MHPPSQPPPTLTPGLLQQALSSGPGARGQLAEAMISIIQVRVGRLLLRAGALRERDGRQEVNDFVQAVLLALFDKDCHALRQWHPVGGLSLENWVGLLAEREVISSLRSRPRNPWTDEPTDDDDEEIDPPASSTQSPENTLAALEHAGLILDRTKACIHTELGKRMFHLLFVERLSVEDIGAITGMKPDQVYNWRSRILGLLRRVAAEVRVEMEQEPRMLSGSWNRRRTTSARSRPASGGLRSAMPRATLGGTPSPRAATERP
jgi:DNA-directed RNA polymerase specialized sigma24 family protein